ncbi:STM4012 family radical SAM protein [Rapidithrix thailandica]|uniref:STM4012 family radical SAM protein n=1 Tax=Rapidithrix thailandica TaxID=413964 RepID=A0AAW9SIM6_9BACT
MQLSLKERINQGNYFQGYAYSYPHKTAYRPFEKPYSLEEIWKEEAKNQLFMYVHVPFCEMRCGFCNLFTVANPKEGLYNPFLKQFAQQAETVSTSLGDAKFSRVAIGGGTPTFLSLPELESLFQIMKDQFGIIPAELPTFIEASPKTIDEDKLAFLKETGISRISMGIQSFIEEETKTLGRPQNPKDLEEALRRLKKFNFPITNLDLIYGAGNQTPESWMYSIEKLVDYAPEEVFLYPLYIRPLTGLWKKNSQAWDDFRIKLYRAGRDYLLTHGYEQVSMRQFRKTGSPKFTEPAYSPQEDGMVGLGIGARSYTRSLHYSSEYAVSSKEIKPIIQQYNQMSPEEFGKVYYGVRLTEEEQKRRYVIKSLCEGAGLYTENYRQFFGTDVMNDFPVLEELFELNLCEDTSEGIFLNLAGHELEDVIGPWLYSDAMVEKSEKFTVL